MQQIGNKILEYLESILDKIINSYNTVNEIKAFEVIKSETINLSNYIYSEKGDLNIIVLYTNDLYNSALSNGELKEILNKSEDIIKRFGLEKQIYGAWNSFKEKNGILYKEFHQWQDFFFEFIANKNNEVNQYFTIELKRYESLYDYLNENNKIDDFDDVFSNESNKLILYQFAKIKFDEILYDAYALINLILISLNDVFMNNMNSSNEKNRILNSTELINKELLKNHIYKDKLAIDVFEKLINDISFGYTLSDFSQVYRYIEENYEKRIKHKSYLDYVQLRFRSKINTSFKSFKIEKAKDSKQSEFRHIIES
jgi:hypothetical protein